MTETNDWLKSLGRPDVLAEIQRGLEQAYRQGVEYAAEALVDRASSFMLDSVGQRVLLEAVPVVRALVPRSPEPTVTLAKVQEVLAKVEAEAHRLASSSDQDAVLGALDMVRLELGVSEPRRKVKR